MSKRDILLPPQIQQLINGLASDIESDHTKINFKNRLIDIRDAIDEEIEAYNFQTKKQLETKVPKNKKYKKIRLTGIHTVQAKKKDLKYS